MFALPAAAQGPRVVVEVTARAEQQVDPGLTRRLIALELGDVEVPPKPGAPQLPYTTVFFRVFVVRADALRVELWDKGEFYGARSVSGEGSKQLRARRIALGAGELVRRLRQRRLAEARQISEERARLEREREERDAWEHTPTVAVVASATGAAIGPGQSWLAGPGLTGQLRLLRGARLDVGLRFLAGELEHSSATWLELNIAPSYAVRVSPGFDVDLGVLASGAAVRFASAEQVDQIEGQHDTWSGRAVAFAYAEPRLAPWARLSVGPEIGAVLRRMPVDDERVGGLWLGAMVGLVIDPRSEL